MISVTFAEAAVFSIVGVEARLLWLRGTQGKVKVGIRSKNLSLRSPVEESQMEGYFLGLENASM